MGKAKIRKKIAGYNEQAVKHISKFNEAKERGSVESMNYMAKELANYLKTIDKLKKRLKKK